MFNTRYTLPAIDAQYIALSQTVISGGNIILNGNSQGVPFMQGGYQRNLSFSSPDDLSSCNFTIYGYSNDAVVIETIENGPNDSTIYSSNVFSSITSIQVNGANATNLSVGSGTTSIFPISPSPSIVTLTAASWGFTIDNPNETSYGVTGTYFYNKSISLENFLSGYNGIFTLQESTSGYTYRFPISSTCVLSALFIEFDGFNGQPCYINFLSV